MFRGTLSNDCASLFKALSDETRQQILFFLKDGAMSVNEIVERTNLSQPTISHHLNILKQVGVVVTRRQGKQIFYALCCSPSNVTCCSGLFNLFGLQLSEKLSENK